MIQINKYQKKLLWKVLYAISFGATIAFIFGCSSVGPAQSALISRWVISLIMTATSIYLANCVQVAGGVQANANVNGSTSDTTPPAAPSSATASATGSSVTINWTNPSTDYDHTVVVVSTTGYASSPTVIGSTQVFNGPGTSFTDTIVADGSTYYYTVFTVDAAGNISASGANASVVSSDFTAPSAPASFTASAQSDGSINLSWVNPTEADFAGVVILRKTGSYATGINDTGATSIYTGTGSSYSDSAVISGTQYFYSIFAFDTQATPNYSVAANLTATPIDTTAPAGVTGFIAMVFPAGNQIDLSWVNPTAADFASVTIVRKANSAPTGINDLTADTIYSGSAASFPDTGLINGTTYFYAIAAYDAAGNQSLIATASAIAGDTVAPNSPTIFAASPNADGSISLSWINPSTVDFAGVKLLRKTGGYATGPGDTGATLIYSGNGTLVTDTRANVVSGTQYFYSIYAFDNAAVANYSTAATALATSTDTTATAAPTGLSATVIAAGGQVDLSWTNPTAVDFASVKVLAKTGSFPLNSNDGTVVYSGGTATAASATGLTNGTLYYFAVYAIDTTNNVSLPAQITATPLDTVAPAAVTGLTISVTSPTSLHLAWTNPTVDFAGVKILRKTGGYATGPNDTINVTVVVNGNVNVLDEPGLVTETIYYYSVYAYDASNNFSIAAQSTGTPELLWVQDAYLKATNAGAADYFGSSVSLSGDLIAVGAWVESNSNTAIQNTDNALPAADNGYAVHSGAVYVFKRDPATGNWSQDAYLKATNAEASDLFGFSVSIAGDLIAIGAWSEDNSNTAIQNTDNALPAADNPYGANSGAVYLFKRDPLTGNWSQDAYLKATNAGVADYFGRSVSLSGDFVAVGANAEDNSNTAIQNIDNALPAADNALAANSGAVYIFKRATVAGEGFAGSAVGDWFQDAYLKATNAEANDKFGKSVSISGDLIAVGAYFEDNSNTAIQNTDNATPAADNALAPNSGAIYVFKRDPVTTNWSQDAYLKATNAGASDYFGNSVSISGDFIAVGAYGEDNSNTAIQNTDNALPVADIALAFYSGAVYVFKRDPVTTNWSQDAYLKATNAGASDYFGNSVSISGDFIAVGARREDNKVNTIQNSDNMVPSIDTNCVGGYWMINIGTYTSSYVCNSFSYDSGAAYIFKRNVTTGNWIQDAYLKANNGEGVIGSFGTPPMGTGDNFGASVAMGNGFVAVGAHFEDNSNTAIQNTDNALPAADNALAVDSGAVYIFKRQ